MAVHLQGAAVDLVEPHQQVDQRGLSAAGGANQSNTLAGLHFQIHILDQGHIRHIAELHMLKLDRTGTVGQFHRIRGIWQDGRFIDKVKHTLGAGQSVLELSHDIRNIVERLGVLVGVVQKH